MRTVCLVWAPFSDRMDELALSIGGERKNFQAGYLPRYLAPLKYLLFIMMTQIYLLRKKPNVVCAQNPPIFCPLACVPYCRLTGARLIVDHHNIWSVKVFGGSRVSYLFRLFERILAVFADVNTVPHRVWKEALERLSAKQVLTVHDYVEANPYPPSREIRGRVSSEGLVGIASGHQGYPLERVEAEALAAESVEGITLAITGPPARLEPRITTLGRLQRVRYLGYLPKHEYDALKASCDLALNITDEPFTVNHVLFEYAAASLPTISSKREVIEAVFGDSLLYVTSSDRAEVAAKLRMLVNDPQLLSEYKTRISRKFAQLREMRSAELSLLKSLIAAD
jgi:glycosyltransferase involved in cell wall biosynthesis